MEAHSMDPSFFVNFSGALEIFPKHRITRGATKPIIAKSKPLKEFLPFPELPVEIRLKIWRLSFPDERHLQLNIPIQLPRDPKLLASYKPPVTLHVNHESRQETLRSYSVLFLRDAFDSKGQTHGDQRLKILQRRLNIDMNKQMPFCIDPTRDTVYINYNPPQERDRGFSCQVDWIEYVNDNLPRDKHISHLELRADSDMLGKFDPSLSGDFISDSGISELLSYFKGLHRLCVSDGPIFDRTALDI